MADDRKDPPCRVNSTLNFSIGAVATALGGTLVWLAWRSFF